MIYALKALIRFRSRSYDCMHDVRAVAMGTHRPWCHRRDNERVKPVSVLLYSHPIVYWDEDRARYQKNEHSYTPTRKLTCSITAVGFSALFAVVQVHCVLCDVLFVVFQVPSGVHIVVPCSGTTSLLLRYSRVLCPDIPVLVDWVLKT